MALLEMKTFVASPEIDSWQDLAVRFRLNFWLSTRAISANLYNDNGDDEDDDDVKVMTMMMTITMTMMMVTMTITMMMDITILLNIRLHYNFTKNRLDLTISKLNIVKKRCFARSDEVQVWQRWRTMNMN